jgi:hypothetical protein
MGTVVDIQLQEKYTDSSADMSTGLLMSPFPYGYLFGSETPILH